MRNERIVIVQKVRGQGDLPGFLPLIHRHFQKARPFVPSGVRTPVQLTASVDLLDMIVPGPLIDQIESVEVIYQARKGT